jgi:hypothetical protein
MRTEELVEKLNADAVRQTAYTPTKTLVVSLGVSAVIAILLAVLLFDPLPMVERIYLATTHRALLNLLFVLSVLSVAVAILRDLSIPGRRPALSTKAVVIPFAVYGVVVAHEACTNAPSLFSSHADHETVLTCLLQTFVLALPAFLIIVLGVRKLAPTDLRRSGFFVGLLAGAVGAFSYCLHAPTDSFVVGTIHASGIAMMAVIGRSLGPALLRWK